MGCHSFSPVTRILLRTQFLSLLFLKEMATGLPCFLARPHGQVAPHRAFQTF